MARKLTKKQRGFINSYVQTGNGTQSALAHYDTKSERVAENIGSENLSKPIIQKELDVLGFNSNRAKSVVVEVLNDENEEGGTRLKAASEVFKVLGDYAPEKSIRATVDINELQKQITEQIALFRGTNVIDK